MDQGFWISEGGDPRPADTEARGVKGGRARPRDALGGARLQGSRGRGAAVMGWLLNILKIGVDTACQPCAYCAHE
jgi:hypothetical protein